jgi:hypothetical protein
MASDPPTAMAAAATTIMGFFFGCTSQLLS